MLVTTDSHAPMKRVVEISLFTYCRANDSDFIDDDERYGWWGDSYPSVTGDRIGSRLWLLRRAKLDTQTRADAERYAREALQWLLDDGHVLNVEILTERVETHRLNLGVVLTLPDGERLELYPNEQWQIVYAV